MSRRGGLCWGHARQRERGQALRPLRPWGQPHERLQRAALAYADADEDADWERARQELYRAARVYAASLLRERGQLSLL